jgi:four helix bundle protein
MTREEMKKRTKTFALRVVKCVQSLPADQVSRVLGNQLLRAGTSVGANYRAVCRAKSNADFVNKLKIVEEEADESLFWMELLVDAGLVRANLLASLMAEADEILRIFVASSKTARATKGA